MTRIRLLRAGPLPCPGHDHEIPGYGSGRLSEDTCAEPGDQEPDQDAGQPVTGFRTKKAAFLSRYRGHPEYGNRSAAGRVAVELAPFAGLRRWADTVLRQHYGGYELRDCWPRHIYAVWELSTLAADGTAPTAAQNPDLARALEFYDRWLPNTLRRIAGLTQACMPQCVMLRRSW